MKRRGEEVTGEKKSSRKLVTAVTAAMIVMAAVMTAFIASAAANPFTLAPRHGHAVIGETAWINGTEAATVTVAHTISGIPVTGGTYTYELEGLSAPVLTQGVGILGANNVSIQASSGNITNVSVALTCGGETIIAHVSKASGIGTPRVCIEGAVDKVNATFPALNLTQIMECLVYNVTVKGEDVAGNTVDLTIGANQTITGAFNISVDTTGMNTMNATYPAWKHNWKYDITVNGETKTLWLADVLGDMDDSGAKNLLDIVLLARHIMVPGGETAYPLYP